MGLLEDGIPNAPLIKHDEASLHLYRKNFVLSCTCRLKTAVSGTFKMRISTKGLRKEEGYSFEDVRRALIDWHIPYEVTRRPARADTYFRSSAVILCESDPEKRQGHISRVMERFNARQSDGYLSCHAYYRITPEFDLSVLNGHPKFLNGMLVEITLIG